MNAQSAGRVIHALAALRDCDGNAANAASKLGISEETLIRALAEVGSNFYDQTGDGRIIPTHMGLRFAEAIDTFPYVNW